MAKAYTLTYLKKCFTKRKYFEKHLEVMTDELGAAKIAIGDFFYFSNRLEYLSNQCKCANLSLKLCAMTIYLKLPFWELTNDYFYFLIN